VYGETILPEVAVKAGAFTLIDIKKDGDKYTGKVNIRAIRADRGASCTANEPIELTLVTPDRIEGRILSPPLNAKLNWSTCEFDPSASWQDFAWIPVK
jgi:hypothetical protein